MSSNLQAAQEQEPVLALAGYHSIKFMDGSPYLATFTAVRESDGAPVIIQSTRQGPAAALASMRLEHAYTITRDLNEPGVVCAEALAVTDDGYALVLPNTGCIPLSSLMPGEALPLDIFFVLAVQAADILARIHARKLIHKDINPAHFLVDPDNLNLQLTDFGIAAQLVRETALDRPPTELEGSLAYMAPEQTGRMNRSIDGRSDLYSLGITFYELLTGQLPFPGNDAAELVHQQLARQPEPPLNLRPSISQPLSDSVMKLLAKEPEDRYQSASGLLSDLCALQKMLKENTLDSDFQVGANDTTGKLQLPERLYGRDTPLKTLVGAIEAASGGRAQLLQVAGHSGIGKSALVREVMRPVAGRRGHFMSGKYDQLNRHMPYSAIIQAFEDLAQKLLTETATRIEQRRAVLLEALGGNAQVILDVIPGLEQLLGKPDKVIELGPSESQYRFNLMFRRFVRALATEDHPLVIFLDDLQWADGASLALLQVLMSDPDLANLTLIGAYRDNEVNAGHPLIMLFTELESSGTPSQSVSLHQLDAASVGEMVADSLWLPTAEAASLSDLVFSKTQGNPFFVRQFLRTLVERDLLVFDSSSSSWRWDVESIRSEDITDNVVDLVAARIRRLDADARHLVQLGSCIGNVFDLGTLAIVSGMTPLAAARALEDALRQEIIRPVGEAYKYVGGQLGVDGDNSEVLYRFPHDRVHHAAYSTIPSEDRPDSHRRIGQLLLAKCGEGQIDERIFEIVNHLNLADKALLEAGELHELAQLNLRAGLRAKASTAFEAALRYLSAGRDILGEGGWARDQQLSFEVGMQHLEATHLTGRFDEAESLSFELLGRISDTLQEVRVRELLIINFTSQLRYRDAVQAATQALALLGEVIPDKPSRAQLLLELGRTQLALTGKSMEDLANLPVMEDPQKLAALRIMLSAGAPAYFESPNLMAYMALRMVRLSVKYGNAGHSAFGYALYASVLCGFLGNMPRGMDFGRLAIALVERYNAKDIKGRVLQVVGAFVEVWNRKIGETLPIYLTGANACLEAGDLEFHGYNRYAHVSYAFMSGVPLDQVWGLITSSYAAVLEHKHDKTQFIFRMVRESTRELRGPAAGPRSEDELQFDEQSTLALWAERDQQALAYYHKYRMVTRYMVRDYEACLESAGVITERYHTVVSMLYSVYYMYFEALALTGLAPSLSGIAHRKALRRVRTIRKKMLRWSEHAPENFRHKYLLLSAELDRVENRVTRAQVRYEEAAREARRHGSLHDEALAYELLGELHLAQGTEMAASYCLREAREAYRRWGGYGWIAHLEARHGSLLDSTEPAAGAWQERAVAGSGASHGLIDTTTITRAARAISEKIVLDDVLRVVLDAALVNVGADRGMLLLAKGDEVLIKAEAVSGNRKILLHSVPMADSDRVPASIINYVAHTTGSLVIDDMQRDSTFSNDPYFARNETCSVICSPLVEKGLLIGFIYLENTLVHGAFTSDRIRTLEVLAAQAAISLENARLYREVSDYAGALEVKVKERTEDLEDAYSTLQDIFGKYVPRRIVEEIVDGKGTLRPTKTTATILFSDIEGFTSISENASPEQVLEMLNEYFPAVLEPIERNGGIVNQFQGDAMLVTFNVPVPDESHADNAVRTAIEIQQALQGREFSGVTLRTRIGINTGEVIAGNVGSGDRINYTVHGDAVNLAARIEQLNKEYGTTVLVSGTTAECLRQEFPLEAVGEVEIRGKAEPATLFQLRFEGDRN